MASDSARISPTAHYTGFVWYRHGLSPRRLATRRGRVMFHALQGPMAAAARATGVLTLEQMLLQRHLMIDHFLEEAIASGRVTQVVEVAAGMSGRGHRFVARHDHLVYVEADLPGMVARKARALGPRPSRHRLIAVDALVDTGPRSLEHEIGPGLDTDAGIALVTEGLLTYFDPESVNGMWTRFVRLLSNHPRGLYLSDAHLEDAAHDAPFSRAFRHFLGLFARGRVHLLAKTSDELVERLRRHGFDDADVHLPREHPEIADLPSGGPDFQRVLRAQLGRW